MVAHPGSTATTGPRPPDGATVLVRLFGEFAVEVGGRAVDLPRGRPRALLARLALSPGPHPRARLASFFWPDILDRSARASLRTALWQLGRALGEGVVWADRERVGLHDPPAVWVDVAAFGTLLGQGRPAEALALVRGELLAGCDDDWVIEERRAVGARVGAAMEDASSRCAREGDRAGAVRWARRRVRLDPLHEPAQRALMRRLADAGDAVGAARAYAALRARLRDELALAPSRETQELARRLGSAPADPPAAGAGAGAGPDGTPADRSVHRATPRPLPDRLSRARESPLAGRGEVVRRVVGHGAATREGGARTVLVSGEAGIGKTRVLAEAAAVLARDGAAVLYGCAGRSARPGGDVLDAVAGLDAGATGPERTGATPAAEALDGAAAAVWGAAERSPVVLIVDDAHRLDEHGAVLVSRIAAGAGRLPVLVACVVRAEEMSPSGPLARALISLDRPDDPVRVALGPLDEDAVDELCRRAGEGRALSASIHRASGGNPLLALDMARSAATPPGGVTGTAPASVGARARALVDWRLAGVGEASADLLALAAVAGPRFDLPVLERAWGLPAERLAGAVDDGRRCGLVVEDADPAGRLRFVHDLVRDGLLSRIGTVRRRRLHARIAAALDRTGPPDPAEAARHWCAAGPEGDPELAVERAGEAARRCRDERRFGEAIELLNGAIALLDPNDPRRRALMARRAVDYLSLEHLLWTGSYGVRAGG